MNDIPELVVDQLKTTEPVQMDSADRTFPHMPGRSTPAEYLPPSTDVPVFTAVLSTTPETAAGNIHGDGPHFARTVEGHPELGTVCGQDGQPWPCAGWQALERLPEGVPMPGAVEPQPDAVAEVAASYGLSVEEMHARLQQHT